MVKLIRNIMKEEKDQKNIEQKKIIKNNLDWYVKKLMIVSFG
jgi:hypothetical protein